MPLTNDTMTALKAEIKLLQDQKKTVQAQLDDVNNHLAPLQQQKTALQAQLQTINTAITNIKTDAGL